MEQKLAQNSHIEEAEFIVRLKARDHKAFNELALQQRGALMFVAMRILGNKQDADDVVQEVLLSAWKYIHTFRGESKISTWLARITRNIAISKLRARIKWREHEVDDDSVLMETSVDDLFGVSPEIATERAQTVEAVQRCVVALPPRQRAVFELRYVQEEEDPDIAAILGISDVNMRVTAFKARQKLRSAIAEMGFAA